MAETNSSSGIKVFLHINGSPQESEKDSTNTIRIDRNSRSDGRVELNVLFPSMVGTSETQLAVALISDAIEQLGRNVDVEMIQLSGLRFSKGGVDGLKAALSIHAFSLKHVVLTDIDFCKKLPGDQDALAAFSSIFAASKLSGLNLSDNTIAGVRCVNRVVEYETALPWQGLRDMAHDTLQSSGRCLGHLAMEGCNLASDNIASLGLCGALNDFPRMRTLNLVRVGLDDQIIKFVSLSLGSTGDCLEWLDLTGNQIGTVGAKSLACLARTPKIAKRLQYLSLENNQIDKAGAVELLDAFGRIGSNEFDLNLKGNPCDMGAVALEIAASQCYTEQQNIDLLKGRDVLRNDIQQAQKNRQSEMKRNLSTFREEVEKLKDDRDTLVKAFEIMGSLEQVEEHRKILNRLAALEQMVFVAPSRQICGQTYTEPSVKDIVSLDHSGRSATSASTAPCNPKSISLSSSLSPSPLDAAALRSNERPVESN